MTPESEKKEIAMHAILLLSLLLPVMLLSCAQDPHQRRADTIKDRAAAFYSHLEHGRVTAAIIENERIEALASELGQAILQRRRQPAANEVDREWAMLTTAREAAAENWLALARYFMRTKRFEEARGTYQRILSSYNEPRFRQYRDQARIGLQDLDMILDRAQSRERSAG
jgi:hypothetical protein